MKVIQRMAVPQRSILLCGNMGKTKFTCKVLAEG